MRRDIDDIDVRGMTLAAYEREIRRRLWRRRMRAAAEFAGGVVVLLGLMGFCWLCCAASGYHWE